MAYGLKVWDGNGDITMNSEWFSARLIYTGQIVGTDTGSHTFTDMADQDLSLVIVPAGIENTDGSKKFPLPYFVFGGNDVSFQVSGNDYILSWSPGPANSYYTDGEVIYTDLHVFAYG